MSMLPGSSVLVTYVLPFPLSLWGVSTTVSYSFQTRNAASVILANSLYVVFTDANPSYTLNVTFPIGVTDYIRIVPAGGDATYYSSSSSSTVWKRTVTNIFALAYFGTWFLNSASVGTWQSNYPNSLTLTGGTTVNWYAAGQTGSTDLLPSSGQYFNAFTLAARWSTSTAGCNATSDILDTYDSVRGGQTNRHTTATRAKSRTSSTHVLLRVCAHGLVSTQPCPDVPQRE